MSWPFQILLFCFGTVTLFLAFVVALGAAVTIGCMALDHLGVAACAASLTWPAIDRPARAALQCPPGPP